jgi:hypothetical protein
MSFSTATNVEIELPVSSDATTPSVRTSMGSAVYAPEKEALVWKIKSFPGGKVGYMGICTDYFHCYYLKQSIFIFFFRTTY